MLVALGQLVSTSGFTLSLIAREEGRRMGLDAFVPCNCFEEGRISRPPEPFRMDDLYRDEEGYICSRRLDRYCEELGYSRYIELYG